MSCDIGSTEDLGLSEIHRKTVASAFWNCLIEKELRESDDTEYTFCDETSREEYMIKVDEHRKRIQYVQSNHECTSECKKRGIFVIIYFYKAHQ